MMSESSLENKQEYNDTQISYQEAPSQGDELCERSYMNLMAKYFLERLFAKNLIMLDAVPYALDFAVCELRKSGVPPGW
jgi:hypothetical protein